MSNPITLPVVSTVTAESPTVRLVIGVLSVVAVAAVVIVLYGLPGRGAALGTPGVLATVNAVLNGSTACFLLTGYMFIRRGNIQAHRTCLVTAFSLSSLFLVTYLLHHAQVGSVPFQHEGWIRRVYFAVLVPHVALAVVIIRSRCSRSIAAGRGTSRSIARSHPGRYRFGFTFP